MNNAGSKRKKLIACSKSVTQLLRENSKELLKFSGLGGGDACAPIQLRYGAFIATNLSSLRLPVLPIKPPKAGGGREIGSEVFITNCSGSPLLRLNLFLETQ